MRVVMRTGFILAVGLILSLTTAASAGVAEDFLDVRSYSWIYPAHPPLIKKDERTPRWWDSGDMPDDYLFIARSKYFGDLYPKDQEDARNYLRLLVLFKTPSFVSGNRFLIVKESWPSSFVAELDKIVEWHKKLWKKDPKEVYELAKKYRGDDGLKTNPYVGEGLLFLAGVLGISKARVDFAEIYLRKESYEQKRVGKNWLRLAADGYYVPAQIDIAQRYLDGRDFEQNRVAAFYWFMRAALNGADVAAEIESLRKEISMKELMEVMEWFRSSTLPF